VKKARPRRNSRRREKQPGRRKTVGKRIKARSRKNSRRREKQPGRGKSIEEG
jgi:hypothetical protein